MIRGPGGQPPFLLQNVMSISGLSLGDQGLVTLTQQDRIIEIPDGIRILPQLTLVIRFDNQDPISVLAKNKLFKWYDDRNLETYDIEVYITNKTFCPQHKYAYYGCSLFKLTENDKKMTDVSFSEHTLVVTPYDVVYFDSLEAIKTFA
jgi:hypothetical protein